MNMGTPLQVGPRLTTRSCCSRLLPTGGGVFLIKIALLEVKSKERSPTGK